MTYFILESVMSRRAGAGTRAERFYVRHGWRDMGRGLDWQIVFTKLL